MRYELTEEALDYLGFVLVEKIREQILKKKYPYGNPRVKGKSDKFATGGLFNSIDYQIVRPQGGAVLGNAPAITITSGDNLPGKTYNLFDVVTYGVPKNKAKPPIDSVLNWIRVRGLRPRDARGRFLPRNEKNMLSLAWAVKQNIFKYGIRPADLLGGGKRSIEQLFQNPPTWLQNEINDVLDAIGGDLENFFDNIIEK